ncbi:MULTISPECIES: CaiB/BaiF CoA-transferase family protein [unclassified Clostridium]|uniref:CaiB/BaiF CoA transferase family protein n=1 Tax=unclassified Clostridium TaxID=2614128 RepID=UPI00110636A6|nr:MULTISPECIES: CaiB/BaiF CoA-transferase family protein [unclassified Clostridium]
MDMPLEGLKVIDLSHHMAGPVASQRLGDMGADVIKVEPLGYGEWTRIRPIGNGWVSEYMNTSFISANRNKRSLTLNLKSAEGKQILLGMIGKADIFISNFRPSVHKRLGLDYDTLKLENRRLVYCSVTGYGQDGPYKDRPGQDLLIQGLSGVTWNAGRDGEPPIPLGTFVADAMAGQNAVEGILAALYSREKTGKGQMVSVDLLSSLIEVQTQEYTTYLNSGQLPERTKELLAHPLINSPYGIHRTKDSYLALAMAPFDKLAKALGCPELDRFKTWEDGQLHRDEIFRLAAEVLKTRTTEEWIQVLQEKDLWCGEVLTYPQVVENPQVRHMEVFRTMESEDYGEVQVVSNPIRFSDTPVTYRIAPPVLGKHNHEILREYGYTEQEIEEFLKKKVIQDENPETFRI